MQGELDMPRFHFVSTSSLIPEASSPARAIFAKASITSLALDF